MHAGSMLDPCWIQAGSSLDPAWIQPGSKPGVLAVAGTPRDPKSYLFITSWVAIQPFYTSEAGIDIKIPARISPDRSHPSISTFLGSFFEPKNDEKCRNRDFWCPCEERRSPYGGVGKKRGFLAGKKTPLRGTLQLPWRAWSQIRRTGAPCGAFVGAIPPHKGPKGAHVAPWGGSSAPKGPWRP